MTVDPKTIAIYDLKADDYVQMLGRTAPDRQLSDFIKALEPGGRVLDLGTGPGKSAAALADRGFRVEAWDLSQAMLDIASQHSGVATRKAGFDDLDGDAIYQGIWANFSLLHAERQDFTRHLAAIHRALVPGGVFHIGMKLGEDAGRDALGRFYTYYQKDELEGLLADAGFTTITTSLGRDSGLSGEVSPWITILSHA